MSKLAKITVIILISLLSFISCSSPADDAGDGISIVATLFPQYDFARNLAPEDAEVTLLLPPGMESHSWEPTPADIIKINKCDLFIYIGSGMESWAEKLLDGIDDGVRVLDLSRSLDLSAFEDEEHSHEHEPHYWCDPKLSMQMTEAIADALCEILPDAADACRERESAYLEKLAALDREFSEIAEAAENPTIYHAGRFAFFYLAKEYGFDYVAAYDSCSSETEPSAAVIASLIDSVRDGKAKAIFYEEMSEPRVASEISNETGAPMLLLHSCHNLTENEINAGEDYISLMQKNAENLRLALLP